MDGIHDLGGRQGFGAVPRGPEGEAVFTADWQRRVFGLAAIASPANTDAFRHAIERLEPVPYLTAGYWGRWLGALELLVHEGDERLRGRPGTAARPLERAPRFAVGQQVRVRDLHPGGHTRMPGYARGRAGLVTRQRGGWVYPDTNAHGQGEQPQHLYGVRFEAAELWGEGAEIGCAVHLDLFEPYLEACPA